MEIISSVFGIKKEEKTNSDFELLNNNKNVNCDKKNDNDSNNNDNKLNFDSTENDSQKDEKEKNVVDDINIGGKFFQNIDTKTNSNNNEDKCIKWQNYVNEKRDTQEVMKQLEEMVIEKREDANKVINSDNLANNNNNYNVKLNVSHSCTGSVVVSSSSSSVTIPSVTSSSYHTQPQESQSAESLRKQPSRDQRKEEKQKKEENWGKEMADNIIIAPEGLKTNSVEGEIGDIFITTGDEDKTFKTDNETQKEKPNVIDYNNDMVKKNDGKAKCIVVNSKANLGYVESPDVLSCNSDKPSFIIDISNISVQKELSVITSVPVCKKCNINNDNNSDKITVVSGVDYYGDNDDKRDIDNNNNLNKTEKNRSENKNTYNTLLTVPASVNIGFMSTSNDILNCDAIVNGNDTNIIEDNKDSLSRNKAVTEPQQNLLIKNIVVNKGSFVETTQEPLTVTHASNHLSTVVPNSSINNNNNSFTALISSNILSAGSLTAVGANNTASITNNSSVFVNNNSNSSSSGRIITVGNITTINSGSSGTSRISKSNLACLLNLIVNFLKNITAFLTPVNARCLMPSESYYNTSTYTSRLIVANTSKVYKSEAVYLVQMALGKYISYARKYRRRIMTDLRRGNNSCIGYNTNNGNNIVNTAGGGSSTLPVECNDKNFIKKEFLKEEDGKTVTKDGILSEKSIVRENEGSDNIFRVEEKVVCTGMKTEVIVNSKGDISRGEVKLDKDEAIFEEKSLPGRQYASNDDYLIGSSGSKFSVINDSVSEGGAGNACTLKSVRSGSSRDKSVNTDERDEIGRDKPATTKLALISSQTAKNMPKKIDSVRKICSGGDNINNNNKLIGLRRILSCIEKLNDIKTGINFKDKVSLNDVGQTFKSCKNNNNLNKNFNNNNSIINNNISNGNKLLTSGIINKNFSYTPSSVTYEGDVLSGVVLARGSMPIPTHVGKRIVCGSRLRQTSSKLAEMVLNCSEIIPKTLADLIETEVIFSLLSPSINNIKHRYEVIKNICCEVKKVLHTAFSEQNGAFSSPFNNNNNNHDNSLGENNLNITFSVIGSSLLNTFLPYGDCDITINITRRSKNSIGDNGNRTCDNSNEVKKNVLIPSFLDNQAVIKTPFKTLNRIINCKTGKFPSNANIYSGGSGFGGGGACSNKILTKIRDYFINNRSCAFFEGLVDSADVPVLKLMCYSASSYSLKPFLVDISVNNNNDDEEEEEEEDYGSGDYQYGHGNGKSLKEGDEEIEESQECFKNSGNIFNNNNINSISSITDTRKRIGFYKCRKCGCVGAEGGSSSNSMNINDSMCGNVICDNNKTTINSSIINTADIGGVNVTTATNSINSCCINKENNRVLDQKNDNKTKNKANKKTNSSSRTSYFLCLLDEKFGNEHLFKKTLLLIKAYAEFDCHILGSHNGFLGSYALAIMLASLLNMMPKGLLEETSRGNTSTPPVPIKLQKGRFEQGGFNKDLKNMNNSPSFLKANLTPFALFLIFLEYYSTFNFDEYSVSLFGPIKLSVIRNFNVKNANSTNSEFKKYQSFLQKQQHFHHLLQQQHQERQQEQKKSPKLSGWNKPVESRQENEDVIDMTRNINNNNIIEGNNITNIVNNGNSSVNTDVGNKSSLNEVTDDNHGERATSTSYSSSLTSLGGENCNSINNNNTASIGTGCRSDSSNGCSISNATTNGANNNTIYLANTSTTTTSSTSSSSTGAVNSVPFRNVEKRYNFHLTNASNSNVSKANYLTTLIMPSINDRMYNFCNNGSLTEQASSSPYSYSIFSSSSSSLSSYYNSGKLNGNILKENGNKEYPGVAEGINKGDGVDKDGDKTREKERDEMEESNLFIDLLLRDKRFRGKFNGKYNIDDDTFEEIEDFLYNYEEYKVEEEPEEKDDEEKGNDRCYYGDKFRQYYAGYAEKVLHIPKAYFSNICSPGVDGGSDNDKDISEDGGRDRVGLCNPSKKEYCDKSNNILGKNDNGEGGEEKIENNEEVIKTSPYSLGNTNIDNNEYKKNLKTEKSPSAGSAYYYDSFCVTLDDIVPYMRHSDCSRFNVVNVSVNTFNNNNSNNTYCGSSFNNNKNFISNYNCNRRENNNEIGTINNTGVANGGGGNSSSNNNPQGLPTYHLSSRLYCSVNSSPTNTTSSTISTSSSTSTTPRNVNFTDVFASNLNYPTINGAINFAMTNAGGNYCDNTFFNPGSSIGGNNCINNGNNNSNTSIFVDLSSECTGTNNQAGKVLSPSFLSSNSASSSTSSSSSSSTATNSTTSHGYHRPSFSSSVTGSTNISYNNNGSNNGSVVGAAAPVITAYDIKLNFFCVRLVNVQDPLRPYSNLTRGMNRNHLLKIQGCFRKTAANIRELLRHVRRGSQRLSLRSNGLLMAHAGVNNGEIKGKEGEIKERDTKEMETKRAKEEGKDVKNLQINLPVCAFECEKHKDNGERRGKDNVNSKSSPLPAVAEFGGENKRNNDDIDINVKSKDNNNKGIEKVFSDQKNDMIQKTVNVLDVHNNVTSNNINNDNVNTVSNKHFSKSNELNEDNLQNMPLVSVLDEFLREKFIIDGTVRFDYVTYQEFISEVFTQVLIACDNFNSRNVGYKENKNEVEISGGNGNNISRSDKTSDDENYNKMVHGNIGKNYKMNAINKEIAGRSTEVLNCGDNVINKDFFEFKKCQRCSTPSPFCKLNYFNLDESALASSPYYCKTFFSGKLTKDANVNGINTTSSSNKLRANLSILDNDINDFGGRKIIMTEWNAVNIGNNNSNLSNVSTVNIQSAKAAGVPERAALSDKGISCNEVSGNNDITKTDLATMGKAGNGKKSPVTKIPSKSGKINKSDPNNQNYDSNQRVGKGDSKINAAAVNNINTTASNPSMNAVSEKAVTHNNLSNVGVNVDHSANLGQSAYLHNVYQYVPNVDHSQHQHLLQQQHQQGQYTYHNHYQQQQMHPQQQQIHTQQQQMHPQQHRQQQMHPQQQIHPQQHQQQQMHPQQQHQQMHQIKQQTRQHPQQPLQQRHSQHQIPAVPQSPSPYYSQSPLNLPYNTESPANNNSITRNNNSNIDNSNSAVFSNINNNSNRTGGGTNIDFTSPLAVISSGEFSEKVINKVPNLPYAPMPLSSTPVANNSSDNIIYNMGSSCTTISSSSSSSNNMIINFNASGTINKLGENAGTYFANNEYAADNSYQYPYRQPQNPPSISYQQRHQQLSLQQNQQKMSTPYQQPLQQKQKGSLRGRDYRNQLNNNNNTSVPSVVPSSSKATIGKGNEFFNNNNDVISKNNAVLNPGNSSSFYSRSSQHSKLQPQANSQPRFEQQQQQQQSSRQQLQRETTNGGIKNNSNSFKNNNSVDNNIISGTNNSTLAFPSSFDVKNNATNNDYTNNKSNAVGITDYNDNKIDVAVTNKSSDAANEFVTGYNNNNNDERNINIKYKSNNSNNNNNFDYSKNNNNTTSYPYSYSHPTPPVAAEFGYDANNNINNFNSSQNFVQNSSFDTNNDNNYNGNGYFRNTLNSENNPPPSLQNQMYSQHHHLNQQQQHFTQQQHHQHHQQQQQHPHQFLPPQNDSSHLHNYQQQGLNNTSSLINSNGKYNGYYYQYPYQRNMQLPSDSGRGNSAGNTAQSQPVSALAPSATEAAQVASDRNYNAVGVNDNTENGNMYYNKKQPHPVVSGYSPVSTPSSQAYPFQTAPVSNLRLPPFPGLASNNHSFDGKNSYSGSFEKEGMGSYGNKNNNNIINSNEPRQQQVRASVQQRQYKHKQPKGNSSNGKAVNNCCNSSWPSKKGGVNEDNNNITPDVVNIDLPYPSSLREKAEVGNNTNTESKNNFEQ